MWRHNEQPGCQPKAQTSTERVRKLTPTGTSAPFWASAPRGAYVGRAALSPRIGHFSGHGLARCQRIIKKGAPFKVGLRRRLGTDGKEHPNGQQKVYWHGRASGKHLDCGQ